MIAHEYILSKQILWAQNNGIKLIGSKGIRGRKAYTITLTKNLFDPLLPEVRNAFKKGDGGELKGNPSKMQAVHSSSALGVNIFQYWLKINQVPSIAAACGFCRKSNRGSQHIIFENKYVISDKFTIHPNIDVVIDNSSKSKFKVFAIECKFSEAYSSRRHSGLKQKYLELKNVWNGIPNLHRFAHTISPKDSNFVHLHPAQLVKHVLGLKNQYGKTNFRLLYLWYDCLGPEGLKHREEIKEFKEITRTDNIYFHALSYQELIIKLSREYANSQRDYIQYITDRYL